MSKSRDPFLDLEEETEKSLHIIQQRHADHRSLLGQVPETNPQQKRHSGNFRPGDLQWAAAPYAVLQSLDRICDEVTQQLVPDVSEDVNLLRTIVEKHVQGGAAEGEEDEEVLSGDEVARRVSSVHRFETKLGRAKADAAEMIKFRDFRQMQISPETYGYYDASPTGAAGSPNAGGDDDDADTRNLTTPQAQKRFVSPSPAMNNNSNAPAVPHRNDFAANFVRQELAEQEKVTAQHGEILTQIHVGVISADQKAKMISAQLNESRAKLGIVERSMDTIQGKLDSAIQSTNKLMETTGDKGKLAMICCLTTVLMLLLFGLFSGNRGRYY